MSTMEEGIIKVKSKTGYAKVTIIEVKSTLSSATSINSEDAKVNQLKLTNTTAIMSDPMITNFGLIMLLLLVLLLRNDLTTVNKCRDRNPYPINQKPLSQLRAEKNV